MYFCLVFLHLLCKTILSYVKRARERRFSKHEFKTKTTELRNKMLVDRAANKPILSRVN